MLTAIKQLLATTCIMALIVTTSCQTSGTSSRKQKEDFISLLYALPTEGDMFTDEACEKASPFLPVIFDLTEKDIPNGDLYPFIAITGGVCLIQDNHAYTISHFTRIRHPELKILLASLYFEKGLASTDMVKCLQNALTDDKTAQILAGILGPSFDEFRTRVMKTEE